MSEMTPLQQVRAEIERRKQEVARKIQARQDRRLGLAPYPDYLQLVWVASACQSEYSPNPESVKNDEKE